MTEKIDKDMPDNNSTDVTAEQLGGELDAAGQSLSYALRMSFVLLTIVMAALIVLFAVSGIVTVGPAEQAIVLRFGEIRGQTTDERVLGSGLQWALPYPVDEVVVFPGKDAIQTWPIDNFWYYVSGQEKLGLPSPPPDKTLDPLTDGYCLTRNDPIPGVKGNDYNIVHSKWELNYRVIDPELFLENIFVEPPRPGESFIDMIHTSIGPVLETLACDAIASTLVKYSIDEALRSEEKIATDAARLVQDKLDDISSGIEVDSLQMTEKITWPRQVNNAFEKAIKARQNSQQLETEADSFARNTINEAGGVEIIEALQRKDISDVELERLWLQVTGQAQEIIAEARAYRKNVVETARANADYFQQLLPEYRKRPELVIQKIYQDAVEEVLENVDEKIIIQHGDTGENELRLLINRDKAAAKKDAAGK